MFLLAHGVSLPELLLYFAVFLAPFGCALILTALFAYLWPKRRKLAVACGILAILLILFQGFRIWNDRPDRQYDLDDLLGREPATKESIER